MANRKAPKEKVKLDPESEAWNKLPWRKLEQHVYRIQKRIYRASQRGNVRAVQKLQKLLMKSEAARLVAVRRVTQDKQGKKTAGVEGVKTVPPKQRFVMAERIHPKHWKEQKPKPVRRVWIPKPGKAEKQPLGIPTMLERAKQALAKSALEPEWEALFEPNSYGLRPGRTCQDAIEAIYNTIRYKQKFVLDADIKGCFDNINQEALLLKLHTYTAMRHAIKAWLKAGVMDGVEFSPTDMGTPQGGVISPLLANIALHGLEEAIKEGYSLRSHNSEKPTLIRYADDFVILHSKKEAIEKAREVAEKWLEGMGLHLSPTKTRVTHTYIPYEGNVGFDFLGFTVRQYPMGKTHRVSNTNGKKLEFKAIITPSKEAIRKHQAEIGKKISELKGAPQGKLIKELNPIIKGWSNYYKTAASSAAYAECDHVMYQQLLSWAKFRHSKRGVGWVINKYWPQALTKRDWTFRTPDGKTLRRHRQTHIIRPYAKAKGKASPYDGNLLYWSQRLRAHPMMKQKLAKLLQTQQGKCRWCELTFKDGDQIEIDHIDGNHKNDHPSNLAALHRHCHDEKHAKPPEEWIHAASVNNN
jgi:RNA-directed DNA polymerase